MPRNPDRRFSFKRLLRIRNGMLHVLPPPATLALMVRTEAPPLRVFISFAPKDAKMKEQLVLHLKVLVRFIGIEIQSADQMKPGTDWRTEIDHALAQADVILLLLSPDYLASDLVQDLEVPKLFERRLKAGAHVIPVLLRSCLWEMHPWFGTLKPLPASGLPIASLQRDKDNRALTEVAAEIAEYARRLTARREVFSLSTDRAQGSERTSQGNAVLRWLTRIGRQSGPTKTVVMLGLPLVLGGAAFLLAKSLRTEQHDGGRATHQIEVPKSLAIDAGTASTQPADPRGSRQIPPLTTPVQPKPEPPAQKAIRTSDATAGHHRKPPPTLRPLGRTEGASPTRSVATDCPEGQESFSVLASAGIQPCLRAPTLATKDVPCSCGNLEQPVLCQLHDYGNLTPINASTVIPRDLRERFQQEGRKSCQKQLQGRCLFSSKVDASNLCFCCPL